MFEWEQGKVGFFLNFFNVDPCAVTSLLVVLKGSNFGCENFISFQVGMLRNLIKNQFQGLVFEVLYIFDFLKEVGLSRFFLLVNAVL